MNTIKTPVAWQKFDDWALTGQHGMRPIYLSVMRGKLCVRDESTDRRVALTPEHPIAKQIVRAVNSHDELLAALQPFADLDRYLSIQSLPEYCAPKLVEMRNKARAAIAKAKETE